jgi:hypothetical protein
LSFFFWPLCCLFFFDLLILITSLWYLQSVLKDDGFVMMHQKLNVYAAKFEQTIIHQHVHLRWKSQSHAHMYQWDYTQSINRLFVHKAKEGHHVRICPFSFGHCVVCSSSIYWFWLPPFGIFNLFLRTMGLLWCIRSWTIVFLTISL